MDLFDDYLQYQKEVAEANSKSLTGFRGGLKRNPINVRQISKSSDTYYAPPAAPCMYLKLSTWQKPSSRLHLNGIRWSPLS